MVFHRKQRFTGIESYICCDRITGMAVLRITMTLTSAKIESRCCCYGVCGEGTCAGIFPADPRRLSIDMVPDCWVIAVILVIKAAGTPGLRLRLCEICDEGC